MALIGNIIWLIFGGLLSGLAYILGGLLLCLTIIGIPFGWANIKLGVATFAPFGKEIV
ncbi:MAG: YccF domain-containing protein, partial [Acidobacteriota bacterium]